nr:structural protein [Tolivirales sp.]
MQPATDRTLGSVERRLAGTNLNQPKMSNHYLACRYDPFSPLPATIKIPDGRGKNVITRDFKTFYDLNVPVKEQLDVRISPTFPYPVRFSPGLAETTTVNGRPLGKPNTATPPTPDVLAILGSPVDSQMSVLMGADGVTQAVSESTNYIGARFISIGYRLFYTGTAANAQGLILVDNLPVRITASGINNNALTQYAMSVAGTQSNVTIAGNTAPIIAIDSTPFSFTNTTSDQLVARPENGVHGVLKMSRLASDHPFAPWFDTGAFVVQSTRTDTNVYNSIYSSSPSLTSNQATKRLGAFIFDDAFMETNIRISAPGTYRLELVVCMEMDLAVNAALIDLARPSPLYDEAALKRDMYLNSMVVPATFKDAPLDTRMAMMNIGGRQRVRKPKAKPKPTPCQQQQPKQTGKAARRRRNRQRKKAKQQRN